MALSAPALLATSPAIRRIGVFRALVLGDLLCATPALRAIKAAWPTSELTLIGLPWAAELAARLPYVSGFEAFPGHPGLPERVAEPGESPRFVARMQEHRFDLLVQLHGSGGIVNSLLADFGASRVVGFHESDDEFAASELHTPWPDTGHEIERLLRLVDHLGVRRRGMRMDLPIGLEDRRELRRSVAALPEAGLYVCLHPGAQLASRRWHTARFAQVGDALAARGLRVVLTGTEAEKPLTAEVASLMRHSALDLAGRTGLFTFAALIESARLVVCNDTGASHVAAAVGTPSVVVSSGGDVARWAPMNVERHRVMWRDMACRPCAHAICPLPDHPCASGIGALEVIAAADAALARPWSGIA